MWSRSLSAIGIVAGAVLGAAFGPALAQNPQRERLCQNEVIEFQNSGLRTCANRHQNGVGMEGCVRRLMLEVTERQQACTQNYGRPQTEREAREDRREVERQARGVCLQNATQRRDGALRHCANHVHTEEGKRNCRQRAELAHSEEAANCRATYRQ